MHTMATHHGGKGWPIGRDIDLHVEDAEGINTGLDNNSESTRGSDSTVALGRPKAESYPNELIPSNQAKLTAFMREVNDFTNG